MKLNAYFLLLSSASAFAPRATFPRPSCLFMQDTAEAIKTAMEASESFGKTSAEARSAWELVEELDAANSHEKQVQKNIAAKQAEIEALMKKSKAKQTDMAPTVHSDTSDAVKRALEASRTHGTTSVEARMAWEEVEEMDAANSHHQSSDVHVAKAPAEEATPAEQPTKTATAAAPQTVEEAINAALFLGKVYGNHASESRLAWELVEELEARDSHKRTQEKMALLEKQVAPEAVAVKIEEKETRADSASAISAAMEASEKFGKTSKEARIAWELVEELDATNAHHKTVGSG